MTAFFTQWGKLDLFQVFFLNSWFFFWNFILEIPTGALADRIGRKWSLVLGSLAGTVGTLVYILRPDFRCFLAGEVIFAFAFTLHSGADDALAYDTLLALRKEKDSKVQLARMENFKLTGIIVGTLLGGFIAQRWGGPFLFGDGHRLDPSGTTPSLQGKKEALLWFHLEGGGPVFRQTTVPRTFDA